MRYIILTLILAVFACADGKEDGNGRYAMESAGNNLYVLDTRTGRLWSVVGGTRLNSVAYSQLKSESWKMDDTLLHLLPEDPK